MIHLILKFALWAALLLGAPMASWAASGHFSWEDMNLTPQQQQAVEQADRAWQQVYKAVQPQVDRDKQEIQRLMTSPDAINPDQLLELQNRVLQNQQRLNQEAMRSFVAKKNQLTPEQQRQLQQLMNRGKL